jgi:hypothetical protein
MGGFFIECTQYPDKAFSGVPQKNPELTSCAKLRKLKAERFFNWVLATGYSIAELTVLFFRAYHLRFSKSRYSHQVR